MGIAMPVGAPKPEASSSFADSKLARVAADGVFLVIGVVPLVLAVAVLLLGSRKRGQAAS
jgi:hypothetical protein